LNRQRGDRRQERIPKLRLVGEPLSADYEARHEIQGFVICRLCLRELPQLAMHIVERHEGWTVERYRTEFPGAPLTCPRTRRRVAKNSKGRRGLNRALWWRAARLRVAGKSNPQIAKELGLTVDGARHVCTRLLLPWCGYDLGVPVTMERVHQIQLATGLSRKEFCRRFGLPERMASDFRWARGRRLSPLHAAWLIRTRGQILADIFAANSSGGMRRWHVPSASGSLAALFPDFRLTCGAVRELVARTRSFLKKNPSAWPEEWGSWLCEPRQSHLLALAADLAPHIERRFAQLRTLSPRLWEQVLADRLGQEEGKARPCREDARASATLIHRAARAKPSPSDDIRWFIKDSAAASPPAAGAGSPKGGKRRGRAEGPSKDTLLRMPYAAACMRLKWMMSHNDAGPLVYPDKPKSAKGNYRRFVWEHRQELQLLAASLTEAKALEILREPLLRRLRST
jgi:hypothetical protein